MENNNSVCFVARINEIKQIEGADKIEQGVIGGWNCIIQKDCSGNFFYFLVLAYHKNKIN